MNPHSAALTPPTRLSHTRAALALLLPIAYCLLAISPAAPAPATGPLTDAERAEHMKRSPLKGRYDEAVDRESAYELLNKRGEQAAAVAEQQAAAKPVKAGREPESIVSAIAKSAARAIGSQIGRQIVRGVLGSLLGGGGRRR